MIEKCGATIDHEGAWGFDIVLTCNRVKGHDGDHYEVRGNNSSTSWEQGGDE